MILNNKNILVSLAFTATITAFAWTSTAFQSLPAAVAQQDSTRNNGKDSLKQTPPAPDSKKKDKAEGKEKKSEYEELVKKGGSFEKGVFGVRHIDGKWYLEVPDSVIGRLFLVVSRFTATPQGLGLYGGEEITRSAVYFEQKDPKTLLLRSYVHTYRADENDNIAKALSKNAIDPIVASLKVFGRPKTADAQLVEITSLFKKDNSVFGISTSGRKQIKVGALDDSRTFIDTIKVFPINMEVATTRTYSAEPGSVNATRAGAMTIGMNTSIVMLPKEPMRPRYFDERVGYFAGKTILFSDSEQGTSSAQIVSRYRLEPKDKKAYRQGKLVEPVKQIVYYIDPATPAKWVPYLIQGVNDWNKAFEAVGFKNAIVAKEWPADESMSLEDARFCVLRYLPSDKQNAYGPHVVDPRSGEIIESHICWYHDVMKLVKHWYMIQCGPLDKRAQTIDFDDKLMGELIRFVSSHEVGHTLGLRHNMGSSSLTPVEKLRDKKWVEAHGHTLSIMDYARFNYVAQPEDGISWRGLFPRINDYDLWAVKWGYQYRPEFKSAEEEKEALFKETTEVLRKRPELWFGGEGNNGDPRAQREDLGDDNATAGEYGMKNLKRVALNLLKWTYKGDQDYDDFNDVYTSLRSQYRRYIYHAMMNLGNKYINNLPDKPHFEEVPRQKVKDAVKFVNNNVFDAPLWLYSDELVSHTNIDADKEIVDMQNNILSAQLATGLLSKMHKSALRSASPYPVDEYLNDVFATVWKSLDNPDERLNSYQRSAQRSYVNLLGNAINGGTTTTKDGKVTSPSDAMLFVLKHLDQVEDYLKQHEATATPLNKLHYQDLLLQIKKIRDKREGRD